jgi:endonuclease/exonuclease/phosphatase family metal-dependent hydrolase
MFKRFIVCLLVATCTLPAFADIDLKIMSFNIRYGTADDGDNSWKHRKQTVVNTIKHYAPDIIGTQETLEYQADYIVEHLRNYRSFGIGRVNDGSGERMEIFYNKKVLTPITIGNFWLSTQPNLPGSKDWDSSLPRMASWAKFWHIESKQFIFYLNTHFDHLGVIARKEASRVIAEQVNLLAGDLPVIITGDFNAMGDTGEPWKELRNTFNDTWLDAKEQIGPPFTFGGFEAPKEGVTRRIDWIFYRGSFDIKKCETVLYNEDGRYPSDHYPIYSEMTLKN